MQNSFGYLNLGNTFRCDRSTYPKKLKGFRLMTKIGWDEKRWNLDGIFHDILLIISEYNVNQEKCSLVDGQR